MSDYYYCQTLEDARAQRDTPIDEAIAALVEALNGGDAR